MITSEDVPQPNLPELPPKPASIHVAFTAPVVQPRVSSFAGLASFLGVRRG